MDNKSYFLYLLVMAGSTYLIRAVPFAAVKKIIENRFIKSFLYYIPYAVLTAMTIPAIFTSTGSVISAAAGLIIAVILSLLGRDLTTVALISCAAVFITELFL